MSGDTTAGPVYLEPHGGRRATAEARAEGHSNASLERTVVRGFVRDDVDWRPAIAEALQVIYSDPTDHTSAAQAVDRAMMRAIHAAHRCDAVRDLGVQAHDSKNPLRRLLWHVHGRHAARARAEALNHESAELGQKEG